MYAVLASERLDALQRMGGEQRSAVSSALAILKEYHTLPVPDEDKASIFELSSTLHHVKFSSPTGHEDKLIGQWSLPPFVCLLSLPNIITLLNAAMLERRIVFVSSNIGYLSACVLSIVPLLRPFIWQGTYVPVLPNHLREYLQAPVPYIMGVHESPHKMTEFRRSLDPSTIVVLCDTNEVVLGSGSPAAAVLPPLPHADVIATNLEPHTSQAAHAVAEEDVRPDLARGRRHRRRVLARAHCVPQLALRLDPQGSARLHEEKGDGALRLGAGGYARIREADAAAHGGIGARTARQHRSAQSSGSHRQ
jgi:hypothetical protein